MSDNKVTIDAAWFAELYEKANTNQAKELRFDNPPQSLWVKIDELTKERDELKAKLEDARHMQAVANENSTAFQKRLAAAERCIEDIAKRTMFTTTNENIVIGIIDIIRAYREKKEEAR